MIGIDEVGRGCWAGPLVAGAVILNSHIEGLADSKVLSRKRRSQLSIEIYKHAEVGLGWVSANEVDALGLTKSVQLAMQRAVAELSLENNDIVIDGNINYLSDMPNSRAVIKADGTIPAVSAASIVAKVARDTYMQELPDMYDNWEFGSHVGYGTAHHSALLKLHGISDLHRTSFKPIRRLVQP